MNKALYSALILLLSTSTFIGQGTLSDSLLLYYRFDGNVADYSQNQIAGTVNGASLTTNRFDNDDSAYSFDGTDDYIVCDQDDIILNQSFDSLTVSLWLYPQAGAVNAFFGSRVINTRGKGPLENNLSGYQIKLEHDANSNQWGLFDCVIEDTDGDYSQCSWCGNLYDYDAWYHLVMVFKPGAMTFYIDNMIDGEILNSNSFENIGNSLPTMIGASGAQSGVFGVFDQFFKGKLDDIRIYNRALSADEIAELYVLNDDELILSNEGLPSDQQSIEVFPNPFEDYINVSGFDNSNFEISTLEGNVVKEGIVSTEGINVTNLTAGVYMLSVRSKSIIHTIRIIKN